METEIQTTEQPVEVKVSRKIQQKDAVYTFITETLGGGVGCFPLLLEGQKLKELVTKDVRKVVRQKLFLGIRSGEIALKKQYDDSRLKKYCSGLINHWLKKDPRFN